MRDVEGDTGYTMKTGTKLKWNSGQKSVRDKNHPNRIARIAFSPVTAWREKDVLCLQF
ncbi:MAG TPA: hypothetical protein VGI46_14135 [Candidatus Acidoferrum sp.]|jgi:hypothetical protein